MKTGKKSDNPRPAPIVITVDALVPLLQIGRTMAYELVRSGQIRSIRIGNRYRIPIDAVHEYINQN